MIMLVYFIDSIYYSLFFVFLFWLMKPEYFIFKIQNRIPSFIEIIFFMVVCLALFDTISNTIWNYIDYGITFFEWDGGEHYSSYAGYLTVFYLMYWLIFYRGSLKQTING